MARDFRHFRPASPEIGSLETGCRITKPRHWLAFLQSVEPKPIPAALPGWRRSADRTRLQTNSLLTGNFTGNFAILPPRDARLEVEVAVPRAIFAQFPTQINREKFLTNREFSRQNKEFSYAKGRVRASGVGAGSSAR